MSETLFTKVDYDVDSLIKLMKMGTLGLPHIQRRFVWSNTKVRDLFDSMYRGYPVGNLLLWKNGFTEDHRTIGENVKQKSAQLLIVDGQQRLTSLYAVMEGIPVLRRNFKIEKIEIAFSPLQRKFAVPDAAIRRDKSFIPNISILWEDASSLFRVTNGHVADLRATREISEAEEVDIQKAIVDLHNLLKYPLTAMELAESSPEEEVATIFVRVNSKGTRLNQADFILTLMSVFWDIGRAELQEFCRLSGIPSKGEPSPFNHFIEPKPYQLLRTSVGLAFKRARLQYVYSILRGKDLETEQFSTERREQQFAILKQAQEKVLNLQHWHDFWKAIQAAGYRGGKMVSSKNSLLYVYAFYLIGRTEYNVDEKILRKIIARWFFMTSLTGRYTASPESDVEADLMRLRDVHDAEGFVNLLSRICDATLTNDYWNITLPSDLAVSSGNSPAMYAYYASLVLLEAKTLFSSVTVSDMLDATTRAPRASIERHHLFPKGFLREQGITEQRTVNQIANFALIEWGDNGKISDDAPSDYYPIMIEQVENKADRIAMHHWHALPDNWQNMPYTQFLEKRREMMAQIVREAYEKLRGDGDMADQSIPVTAIDVVVQSGEGKTREFKSTLRMNMHTKQPDPRMELGCLKTVAALLNTYGGTLVIGVADNGDPVGIEADGFPDEDKMLLHFSNLVNSRIGPEYEMYIHPHFEDYRRYRILAVECMPAKSAVYVKDGNTERFYVRSSAATRELLPSEMQTYIKQRFG